MSARTTETAVKGIIEVDAISVSSLEPFISIANELVTEKCGGLGYSDTRLELIERWLSAHFYTVRDPRVTSETAGPVSASYQSSVSLGLNSSHYGQTALRLDTMGGLASLEQGSLNGGRKIINISHIGRCISL